MQRKVASTNIIAVMESGTQTTLSRELAYIRFDEPKLQLNPVPNLGSSNKQHFQMSIGNRIVHTKLNSYEEFQEQ